MRKLVIEWMGPVLALIFAMIVVCGCTDEKSGITSNNGVDVLKGDSTYIAEQYIMQHASVDNGSIRFGIVHSEFGVYSPAINMPMTFTTNGTQHYAQVIYEPTSGKITFATIDGVAV